MPPDVLRLGAGSGFAADRIDPASDLAARGDLDYLIFECPGERTVAAGSSGGCVTRTPGSTRCWQCGCAITCWPWNCPRSPPGDRR